MALITIEESFTDDQVILRRDDVLIGWTEPARQEWEVYDAADKHVATFASRELALSHLRLMATKEPG